MNTQNTNPTISFKTETMFKFINLQEIVFQNGVCVDAPDSLKKLIGLSAMEATAQIREAYNTYTDDAFRANAQPAEEPESEVVEEEGADPTPIEQPQLSAPNNDYKFVPPSKPGDEKVFTKKPEKQEVKILGADGQPVSSKPKAKTVPAPKQEIKVEVTGFDLKDALEVSGKKIKLLNQLMSTAQSQLEACDNPQMADLAASYTNVLNELNMAKELMLNCERNAKLQLHLIEPRHLTESMTYRGFNCQEHFGAAWKALDNLEMRVKDLQEEANARFRDDSSSDGAVTVPADNGPDSPTPVVTAKQLPAPKEEELSTDELDKKIAQLEAEMVELDEQSAELDKKLNLPTKEERAVVVTEKISLEDQIVESQIEGETLLKKDKGSKKWADYINYIKGTLEVLDFKVTHDDAQKKRKIHAAKNRVESKLLSMKNFHKNTATRKLDKELKSIVYGLGALVETLS